MEVKAVREGSENRFTFFSSKILCNQEESYSILHGLSDICVNQHSGGSME
jgi:hypothetical protein